MSVLLISRCQTVGHTRRELLKRHIFSMWRPAFATILLFLIVGQTAGLTVSLQIISLLICRFAKIIGFPPTTKPRQDGTQQRLWSLRASCKSRRAQGSRRSALSSRTVRHGRMIEEDKAIQTRFFCRFGSAERIEHIVHKTYEDAVTLAGQSASAQDAHERNDGSARRSLLIVVSMLRITDAAG